jgi:hypothetical protein
MKKYFKKKKILFLYLMQREKNSCISYIENTYGCKRIPWKFNFLYNMKLKNELSYWYLMNKQIDFFRLHIIYEVKGTEKEICECEKMNKQMDFFSTSYYIQS